MTEDLPTFDLPAKTMHGRSAARKPDGLTAEDIRLMKKAYYAKMTLIDRKIGEVLDTLKKRAHPCAPP